MTLAVEQFDNKDGGPDPAPALAQKAIGDAAILGIVGPAFSGETEASEPLFEQAGLAIGHGVGDAHRPHDEGLDEVLPRASATTTRRVRSGGMHRRRDGLRERSPSSTTSRRTAPVSARSSRRASRTPAARSSCVRASSRRRTTRRSSTRCSSEEPDLVYYAGYSSQSSARREAVPGEGRRGGLHDR